MKKVITILSVAVVALMIAVIYLLWQPAFLGVTSQTVVTDDEWMQIKQPHGTFLMTVDYPVTSTASRMALPFDTNVDIEGLTHPTGGTTASSTFTFPYAGHYKVIISAIADTTAGGGNMEIWFAKNGVDIANSNTLSVIPASVDLPIAVPFTDSFAANDTLTVYARGSSTNILFNTTAAGTNPTRPLSPAIIMTLTRVSN